MNPNSNEEQQRLLQSILAFQQARLNQAMPPPSHWRAEQLSAAAPRHQAQSPTVRRVIQNPIQGIASLYSPDPIQLVQQSLLQEQLLQRQQAFNEQTMYPQQQSFTSPGDSHLSMVAALQLSHQLMPGLNQGLSQHLDIQERVAQQENMLRRRLSEETSNRQPRPVFNTEESKIPSPPEARADEQHEGRHTADGDEEEADDEGSADLNQDRFPFKLHQMMVDAENEGKEDIVSFLEDENAFMIHKPGKFCRSILPRYFTSSRLSSFQRQLNLYGFRRISEGAMKGGYRHKHFLKGKPRRCKYIKRKTASQGSPSSSARSSRSQLRHQSDASVPTVGGSSNVQFSLVPPAAPMPTFDQQSLLSLLMMQRERQQDQNELIRALLDQQLQGYNRR